MCVNLCANKTVLMINDMLLNLWKDDPFAFAEMHYWEQHNMKLNLSGILVPEKPAGEDVLLLYLPEDLTANREFDSWDFLKWKRYDDLDTLASSNQRDTTQAYFIWIRSSSKPDAEFLGLSAGLADPSMSIGVTLRERLALQSHAHRVGLDLDKNEAVTFCSGSLNSDGRVPSVRFSMRGEVCVGSCDLNYCYDSRGIRRVWA